MNNENIDDYDYEDEEYNVFQKWYKEEQRGFHCAQMNLDERCYASFLYGLELGRKELQSDGH